jgi:transcriptional regulator with XRE-family HTH domain
MLRIRRGWRQRDVGTKAKLSAAAIGRHENGIPGSLDALERHAAVFGLRLDLTLHGRAGELARLADEEHAAIVEAVAANFRRLRFVTETEASFSEWGERGRIDLLAFDPRSGMLVIVEAKTQLLDLQDLFGALNVKERLASTLASRRGWQVRHRASVLAVAATSANREVVAAHPSLFAGFPAHRLGAFHEGMDGRALFWVAAARAARPAWIAGRQRVRKVRPQLSSREAYPMSATSNEPSEPSPLAR